MTDNTTSTITITAINTDPPNWDQPEKIAALVNRFASALKADTSSDTFDAMVACYARFVMTESARLPGNSELNAPL